LAEYEETFKTRLKNFTNEIRELETFEKDLSLKSKQLDLTLTEKEACKDISFAIKQHINSLKTKRENLLTTKETV
jgi:hypothetical protein